MANMKSGGGFGNFGSFGSFNSFNMKDLFDDDDDDLFGGFHMPDFESFGSMFNEDMLRHEFVHQKNHRAAHKSATQNTRTKTASAGKYF